MTGAKTEDLARNAARTYAKIIQKLDYPVKFKVQNLSQPLAAACWAVRPSPPTRADAVW